MQKNLALLTIIFLVTVNLFSATGKVQTQIGPYDKKRFLGSYENYGFGYRLYNPNSQYDPGPVYFELDEPEKVYTLAYDNNTITGGCYNSNTYTWYVCDDSGYIWTINIYSGDMTQIGGICQSLSALAYDPQTNTMFGCFEDFLCAIDMQSAEILWVWDISEYFLGPILGMAANGQGSLYIVDTFDDLWIIDIDTLTATCIGPLFIGIEGNADLEFDFSTEILYLSTYTTQGELYKVDTWDGEATIVGNFQDGARISGFIIPWNWPPYPPEPPEITGPTQGKINIGYDYKFVSIDPDADELTYIIYWGDGDVEEHGLYHSGEPIIVKHAWSEEGTYTIKAKARKLNGLESNWGYLDVTMPKNKMTHNLLFKILSNLFPNLLPILRYIFRLA